VSKDSVPSTSWLASHIGSDPKGAIVGRRGRHHNVEWTPRVTQARAAVSQLGVSASELSVGSALSADPQCVDQRDGQRAKSTRGGIWGNFGVV